MKNVQKLSKVYKLYIYVHIICSELGTAMDFKSPVTTLFEFYSSRYTYNALSLWLFNMRHATRYLVKEDGNILSNYSAKVGTVRFQR